MTKKQIKILALSSFIKGNLDEKRVKKYVKLMKRKELRQYIRFLKIYDSQKKVVVFLPDQEIEKENIQKDLKKLFNGKRVVFKENKSLILGLKLIDNDIIYDFNLKNNLENINNFIGE